MLKQQQTPKGRTAYLWASVEPSGLQVAGELPDDVWEQWDREFMARASAALGFPVRDAEEENEPGDIMDGSLNHILACHPTNGCCNSQ